MKNKIQIGALTIVRAQKFARRKHKNQARKITGKHYITHPIRVSQRVQTGLQMVIALLHDTLEDTNTKYEEIEEEFGEEIAKKVKILTHPKDGSETYMEYIERVKKDEDCKTVKIADICDNLNDNPSQRMIEKAHQALLRLNGYT